MKQTIGRDLGGGSLRWKLDNFKQRLVFVPETREEYAASYKKYCIGVIDIILNETRLENPYTQIKTLQYEQQFRFVLVYSLQHSV